MSKMVVTLWIPYSRQVGYMLEKFRSFGIIQHNYTKKHTTWKEIENDSKYYILNNFFMEVKNANPNG